jgi:DNA helicase-2/ATP-dependent DNA helicase PcrA
MPLDLSKIDADQRAAVTAPDGAVIVFAGAGSGKTRTLTARIAYLIEREVAPGEIMAVTFTRKAADEMRRRISAIVGETAAAGLRVGTFHAQMAQILRRAGSALEQSGRSASFTVMDEDDRERLVKRILKELSIDQIDGITARAVIAAISRAKNEGLRVDAAVELRTRESGGIGVVAARVWPKVEEAARAADAFDFDDLLTVPLDLMTGDPALRLRWSGGIRYLIVDEFQDTNLVQLALVRALASVHGNLFVVGDDAQSIYRFRGARIENIADFRAAYPERVEVTIKTNYRSTEAICAVANAAIRANRSNERKFLTAAIATPVGPKPVLRIHGDERAEAAAAAAVAGEARIAGLQLKDMAILVRTNAQTRPFEQALSARGLAYRILGGTAFWSREEVRDLVAYLRLTANPRDEMAIRRSLGAPRRGIGDVALERIAMVAKDHGGDWFGVLRAALAGEHEIKLDRRGRDGLREWLALADVLRAKATSLAVAELIEMALNGSGIAKHHNAHDDEEGRGRVENLREVAAAAVDFGEGELSRFIETAVIDTSTGSERREPPDAVTIATLHAAKGLEWPIVVIGGLEEGLLPHGGSAGDPAGLEEERRLFYVGVTRARRRLYLSAAAERYSGAARGTMRASRFLAEVREEIDVREGAPATPNPRRFGAHRPSASGRPSFGARPRR